MNTHPSNVLGRRLATLVLLLALAFGALAAAPDRAEAHDSGYCGLTHSWGYYRDYYEYSFSRYFGGNTYLIYRQYSHWSHYGYWHQYSSARVCGSYQTANA